MLTRRQFIRRVAGGTAAAGLLGYAGGIEPRRLELSHVTVPLHRPRSTQPPLRILHLSDLHLSFWVSLDFIAESFALGLAEKPDLILLTGDFCTGKLRQVPEFTAVLARLPAAAPTFACLGNHDGGRCGHYYGAAPTVEPVRALLRGAGITSLLNEHHALTIRGQEYQLFGVGDLWSNLCAPDDAFAGAPSRGDAIRLVLNHNPDAKDRFRAHDWDVMLCGHTHGGQVRLPLIGTPFAPVTDKRYVEGLHRWDNRWMYITRGVGNLHGLRFNCPPEVSVLTLA